ncbi:putative electron transfer flavoprotein [Trypanosoma vivax]|nr:putative electron transfer flavoprotein [Trypanosoma vivax]
MFSSTPVTLLAATGTLRMRIAVGVKRVVDYSVRVRVRDNKIQSDSLKMSVNPFDEIAIEEAVRLKERNVATEVIAVTVGSKKAEEVLRTAMALGCDSAIHVVTPEDCPVVEPIAVAKIFRQLHNEMRPDVWLLGKQAIDGDLGVTAPLLAGILNVPQGTFASKVEFDSGRVRVTREVDVGHQVVELQMPCVLSADLRLNTPRFAKLPSIMKARKKPIDVRDVLALGVDITPRLRQLTVAEPPLRKAGIRVKSVEELYDKLHNEAKVL